MKNEKNEKVVCLIKGLDKPIRKQFVPVPNTVEAFLKQAVLPSAGKEVASLLVQLVNYLNKTLRPPLALEGLHGTQK